MRKLHNSKWHQHT